MPVDLDIHLPVMDFPKSRGLSAAMALPALLVLGQMLQLLTLLFGVAAGAPDDHLITSLPGQKSVNFKQYGGYVTVNAKNGRALYYYFVEAETKADSKPVTLWLNGGPGCSSLGGGAFTELGPFYTRQKSLFENDKAWNQVSNVLFLESPAGVGFSYSNTSSDYHSNDAKTAQDSLTFLVEWFKKFPEYRYADFFITGESYAGHYGPQLAAAVLKNNDVPGQSQIQLKGLLVGNPLFDLGVDTSYSPAVFLWSHGLVSQTTYDSLIKHCKLDGSEESETCNTATSKSDEESGLGAEQINAYDVLVNVCESSASASETRQLKKFVNHRVQTTVNVAVSPCIEEDEAVYLNLPEVQKALHARSLKWAICSSLLDYSTDDLSIPMLPVLQSLLSSGLRVWIFSGDQDSVIPLIGTRQLVGQLARDMNLSSTSSYGYWLQDKQVGGWTESWQNLTYATVRGAGHMVPATQPSRALELFTSFLSGKPLR